MFRGGGKIFAGNGAEPVDPKADNELAISKGGADVLTFLHPFPFPGGPGEVLLDYPPTYTLSCIYKSWKQTGNLPGGM